MTKHPWHLMNFDLPNCDLHAIWMSQYVKKSCIIHISKYRRWNELGPARWAWAGPNRPQSREYQAAIAAEIEKAKQWKQ